jgi:hypothetical protein
VNKKVLFVEQKKIRSLWVVDWKWIWFLNEKLEGEAPFRTLQCAMKTRKFQHGLGGCWLRDRAERVLHRDHIFISLDAL